MPPLVSLRTGSIAEIRDAAVAGTLFAVLDACDEPNVPTKVHELMDRAASLYDGESQEQLWAIAPYLARVDTAMLDWIQASLWHAPWGIFAIARADLTTMLAHFRKFLHVVSPGEETWNFRFYDPRVLDSFLPTCNATELADFFGPATQFGWAGATADEVTVATLA